FVASRSHDSHFTLQCIHRTLVSLQLFLVYTAGSSIKTAARDNSCHFIGWLASWLAGRAGPAVRWIGCALDRLRAGLAACWTGCMLDLDCYALDLASRWTLTWTCYALDLLRAGLARRIGCALDRWLDHVPPPPVLGLIAWLPKTSAQIIQKS